MTRDESVLIRAWDGLSNVLARAFDPRVRSAVRDETDRPATAESAEERAVHAATARRWILPTVVAVTVLLSGFMRTRLPVLVLGSGGDDLLFARIATSLTSGHWLGPFDYLTLSKGPSYPAFVGLMYMLSIPLKIGEQLTLLLAAGTLATGVALVLRRAVVGVVIFAGFSFLPDNFAVMNSWVLRDGWYASVSLLLVAGLFLTAFLTTSARSWRWPIVASSMTGLAAAAFWLCREEGIWILPSAAVIVGWFVTNSIRASRRHRAGRNGTAGSQNESRPSGAVGLRRPFAVLAVLLTVATLPIAAVLVENHRNYGAALTNDMASGSIPRAYAQWLRVRAGQYNSRVPINREQRAAVYRVSPAARQLRVWLDERPNGWLVNGCVRRPDSSCDYSGSVLIWAIRNAAQSAGHFGTESDAQAFFGAVANQISGACRRHELDCAASLPTSLQPLQRIRVGAAFAELRRATVDVLWSRQFTGGPSVALHPNQQAWDRIRRIVPETPIGYEQAINDIRSYQRHEWPYRILEWIYRLAFPILLLVGIIGLVLGAVRRTRTPLVVLGGALLLGAMSRLVLLAITATSQFGTGLRYQMPTRLMLFGTAAVGIALLVDARRPRRAPDSGRSS